MILKDQMFLEEKKTFEKLGEKVGYTFSYFLFTTILFFILVLLKKIPESWSYVHVMGITLLITSIGIAMKRFLK